MLNCGYTQQVESEVQLPFQTHEIDDECLEITDNGSYCIAKATVETILKCLNEW